jgi:hypothetical protein
MPEETKEIAIETLLFGEYYVAVYENQDLVLENKYYCINKDIAEQTAKVLQEKYPGYEIKYY